MARGEAHDVCKHPRRWLKEFKKYLTAHYALFQYGSQYREPIEPHLLDVYRSIRAQHEHDCILEGLEKTLVYIDAKIEAINSTLEAKE